MPETPELIVRTWRYTGPVDELAFHDALADLLARHRILRTGKATFRYLALPSMGGFREFFSQQLAAAAIAEPSDEGQADGLRAHVVRFEKEGGIIILVAPAETVDEWSMQLLMRDFAAFYEVRRTREGTPDLPATRPYSAPEGKAEVAGKQAFGFEKRPPEELDPNHSAFAAYHFQLGPDIVRGIVNQTTESSGTPGAVLLTAFKQLAGKHGAPEDVAIARLESGRGDPRFLDTVGNFAYVVPEMAELDDTAGLVVPVLEFRDSPLLGQVGKAADLSYVEEFAAPNPDDDSPAFVGGMRWTFALTSPDEGVGTVRYRRSDFSLEAVSGLVDEYLRILAR